MGIDDKILGELTKKFGISGDQAKSALDFVRGKLGGGGEVGLLSQIKSTDLLHHDETHQEAAKSSGLPVDKVKEMLPEIAKMLGR
jgi:hypothetical protein